MTKPPIRTGAAKGRTGRAASQARRRISTAVRMVTATRKIPEARNHALAQTRAIAAAQSHERMRSVRDGAAVAIHAKHRANVAKTNIAPLSERRVSLQSAAQTTKIGR